MKTLWPDGLQGAELFRFLKANKTAIFDMKKSVTKVADLSIGIPAKSEKMNANKAYAYANDEKAGKLIRTIVMNTYNWLDSHDDVHQTNLFAKSIGDKGTRIPHLHDHEFKLTAKVGMPISWSEDMIPWKTLGVQLDGETMALILQSEIQKSLNKVIYKAYLNDLVDQHSVSMQYVTLAMAINDADYEEEFKVWQETFPKIGNQSKATEQGYYFPIYTAKLFEGSGVIAGSNELTPTLGSKFQPSEDIEEQPELHPLDIDKMVNLYM
jgi:hypothetical protein